MVLATQKIPFARIACQNCADVGTLMAGVNVSGGASADVYQVCWRCKIALRRGMNEEWQPIPIKPVK